MPVMPRSVAGRLVPSCCFAFLLLVLCLLPAAAPAAGGGCAPWAVSEAGEARGLMAYRPMTEARRTAGDQTVRTADPSGAAADDCPEWYRPEKERLASLDFEARAAERWRQTWEAAKVLLLVAFLAILFYYAAKYGTSGRVAMKFGMTLLIVWTDRGDGEEDLRRQEATKEKYRKYVEEHPREKCMLVREELPIFVKWGKRLVRKWRAWEQDDTTASSWAAEVEKFSAELQADVAALHPPQKKADGSAKEKPPVKWRQGRPRKNRRA